MAEALGATFFGGSAVGTETKWAPKAPTKVEHIDADASIQGGGEDASIQGGGEPISSQEVAEHLDRGDVHGARNPTTTAGEHGAGGKGYLGLIVDLFKPGGERQLKFRDFRRVSNPKSFSDPISCASCGRSCQCQFRPRMLLLMWAA